MEYLRWLLLLLIIGLGLNSQDSKFSRLTKNWVNKYETLNISLSLAFTISTFLTHPNGTLMYVKCIT